MENNVKEDSAKKGLKFYIPLIIVILAVLVVKNGEIEFKDLTFSFNKVQKGFATIMGVTPEQATLTIIEEKPDIIGANCGSVTIENMVDIAKTMKRFTQQKTTIVFFFKFYFHNPFIIHPFKRFRFRFTRAW